MNVYEALFFKKKAFSDTVGNELKENGQNIKVKGGIMISGWTLRLRTIQNI